MNTTHDIELAYPRGLRRLTPIENSDVTTSIVGDS